MDHQEAESSIMEDQHLVYRKIFTLEGSIRYQEHGSLKGLLKAIDELFLLYDWAEDIPPSSVIQMIADALDERTLHFKLISPQGEISSQLIRKLRFSGISDLKITSAIRQAQKEGKRRENPGGKVKCLDPRFTRIS